MRFELCTPDLNKNLIFVYQVAANIRLEELESRMEAEIEEEIVSGDEEEDAE